jgi:hypothetical protein
MFLFVMVLTITLSFTFVENSFAQEMTPLQQWKKFADPDMLTCKSGHLLLQKSNGNPACVMPTTYLKLVERGYALHNQSIMDKNPEMMNSLMKSMATNESIMHHWHEMMQKNPAIMNSTVDDWVSQMKKNSELLKNMLAPMTSDPQLREKMIQTMKNHPDMETHLKMNSQWMDSIHQPMAASMDPDKSMGHGDSDMSCPMCEQMREQMMHDNCTWCPVYEHRSMGNAMTMTSSDKMMDVIHHVWINSKMAKDMHTMMLENPSHMAVMSHQMMEPMLNGVMDDADLREQMVELMLQHQDFMNSIRHDNPDAGH